MRLTLKQPGRLNNGAALNGGGQREWKPNVRLWWL